MRTTIGRKRVGSRSVKAAGRNLRKAATAARHSCSFRRHSLLPGAAAWTLPCTTTLRQLERPSTASTWQAAGQEFSKLELTSSRRVSRAVRPHSVPFAKT
jgi:hypothetical protein